MFTMETVQYCLQDDDAPMILGAWDEMCAFELASARPPGLEFVPFDHGKLQGLVCHRACYDLLACNLKYLLKIKDVRPLAKTEWEARLMEGDYGGILAYQDQVLM